MPRRTLIIVVVVVAGLGPQPAPGAGPGEAEFFQGLDALQNQRWAEAAKAFAAAVDGDDENAEYHMAYGIASMMADDLPTAKAEFDRALRLKKDDVTIQRWAAGYYRFIGDALTAAKIRSPADYPRTVQEAAEKVHQLKRHQVPPQEVEERWRILHGFAVRYARERIGASPQLASVSLDRAKQMFAAGKVGEALADLTVVLQANPYDMEAIYWKARCLLARGALYEARDLLTRVLIADTASARGYAARAVAEARLGAVERGRADFALAQRLGAAAATELEREFEAAVADATAAPASPFDELVKAAAGQDNPDGLLSLALPIVRAQNNQRRRWDEWYQDELRRREDDVRSAPQDSEKMLELGRFLYRQIDIPGEQLSPGGEYRAFRYHTRDTLQREIERAEATFDQVLRLDPRAAEALAWKAAIRIDRGDWPGGESLVMRALEADPNMPLVLELLSRVLDHTATMKSFEAADLRRPDTWTEYGISYYILWTRHPSQAELAQANVLEAQARALWAKAEATLEKAVQKLAGTADGAYYGGLMARRRDDHENALKQFQEAVRLDPDSSRNQQATIRTLFRLGRTDEAGAAQEQWVLLHQTTATLRLAKAWADMDRTAWKSATVGVDSALTIDPADPRVPFFRAAIATARGRSEEAANWLMVALALESARATLGGADLRPNGQGELEPDTVATTMLMNMHLAWRYAEMRQPEKRLAALLRNVALEPRLLEGWREEKSARAVLPMPTDERSTRQRTISNLLAWSKVMAGYAYVELGKADEAYRQFKDVTDWYKRDSYADAQGLAFSGMTRLYWGRHDPEPGRREKWLENARIVNRLDDDERQAAMELVHQVGREAGKRMDEIQREQQDLRYWYGARPAQPGGYDPRHNPNYHGNDDAPPGMRAP